MLSQVRAQRGKDIRVQTVRQDVQEIVDAVNTPADPLRHEAVPVPVLRQALPPEVRHEEAHVHSHR